MANYSTASKVLQVIQAGDDVERWQGKNRKRILDAANCKPPLSDEEAADMGVKVNVNWGELLISVVHGASQLTSAFAGSQNFFTVKLPIAPDEKKSDWEAAITSQINSALRKSTEWFCLQQDKFKCLTLHGVAAVTWRTNQNWRPRFVALADLRIPTDTVISFENLDAFAIRVHYTVYELCSEAFNDRPNNGWNKKAVVPLLNALKEINTTDPSNNYDVDTDVERYAELIKQDGGWYASDALPTIPLFHFYFKDRDENDVEQWYMRVVPESGTVRGSPTYDEFLWTSEKPIAKSWKEIIHCQFGDLSADSPARFHSVRGLGFILYEPTFYSNLNRCRMLQHLFDGYNVWLRNNDPADKARAQIQEFGNYSVVKPGISLVPANERHQVDKGLIEMAFGQTQQLRTEASSSYTQQSDTGTQKEQTAFETRVKMEQVNALMGGILTMAFKFETGCYVEICRRFCIKNSTDPDVLKFQSRMKQAGVPAEWLDIEQWDVEPVTPLGWGNPTIAQAAAPQLMGLRPLLTPDAQQEIVHENVLVITKDPRKAARWAPVAGRPQQSDAFREAQGLFGTLMTGVQVKLAASSPQDQIDALLPLLAGVVTMITKRNNMATVDEARGMMNVAAYIGQAIQALSQDQSAKEKVKQYSDSMGQINNEIKALAQRGAEAAKAQQPQGDGGGGAAKVQSTMMLTKAKMDATKAQTAQKMHHADIAFKAQQRRDDARAHADIQRGELKTESEVKNSAIKTILSPKPAPKKAE